MNIEYVNVFSIKKKTGKTYWYAFYRRNGQRIRMAANPHDPLALAAEAVELGKRFDEPDAYQPGSIGALIAAYEADAEWFPENEATRKSYRRAFAILTEGTLGSVKVRSLRRATIISMRDSKWLPKHGRWAATNTTRVLKILLAFALDRGAIEANPLAERVRQIRRPKDAPEPNRPWTLSERSAVLSAAPPHILLPLAMILCTGLRKHDVLTAPLSALQGPDIRIRTRKRGVHVAIPIHAILADALRTRQPCDATTICVNHYGQPWTSDGFNSSWSKFKKRLEQSGQIGPGLTLHGGRHTFKYLLDEMGVAEDVRMKLVGHQSKAQHAAYAASAPIPEGVRGIVRQLKIKE